MFGVLPWLLDLKTECDLPNGSVPPKNKKFKKRTIKIWKTINKNLAMIIIDKLVKLQYTLTVFSIPVIAYVLNICRWERY